jgi:hypothetical protein
MDKLNRLSEVNPMLGFRGCRLGVVFPEISAMQVWPGHWRCVASDLCDCTLCGLCVCAGAWYL